MKKGQYFINRNTFYIIMAKDYKLSSIAGQGSNKDLQKELILPGNDRTEYPIKLFWSPNF